MKIWVEIIAGEACHFASVSGYQAWSYRGREHALRTLRAILERSGRANLIRQLSLVA
jgi:hypothetical protein